MSEFWIEFFYVLFFLGDYNSTVVSFGAAMLGVAGGAAGVFAYLRRRSMISDAVSHSTLPGVVIAYIISVTFFGESNAFVLFILGGCITAFIGLATVSWITEKTILSEDAAIGTVLSTFYALGIVFMTVVQALPTGGQSQLQYVFLGATASISIQEAYMISGLAIGVFLVVIVLTKEYTHVAFDPNHARRMGIPVGILSDLLLALLVLVIVIGLKIVGIVLIVAVTIIPPVIARLWCQRTLPLMIFSSIIGGLGAHIGIAISSIYIDAPAGATIVLVLFFFFAISLIFSPFRGILAVYFWQTKRQEAVRLRSGLLTLVAGQKITHKPSIRLLKRKGFLDNRLRATKKATEILEQIKLDQQMWNYAYLKGEGLDMEDPSWGVKYLGDVLPVSRFKKLLSDFKKSHKVKVREF